MSKTPTETGGVLCWPKKVLSADDLRRHLTGQRELSLLPRTIVTPLAMDELKAKGVRISTQLSPGVRYSEPLGCEATWFYAQEKPDTMFSAAIAALARDGVTLTAYEIKQQSWIIAFAEMLLERNVGGIANVAEPGIVCCFANKVSGIRAASVSSVANVKAAKKSLGPNLFAIAPQGRTFFELRQMVQAIASELPKCPDNIATALQELDGHAHR